MLIDLYQSFEVWSSLTSLGKNDWRWTMCFVRWPFIPPGVQATQLFSLLSWAIYPFKLCACVWEAFPVRWFVVSLFLWPWGFQFRAWRPMALSDLGSVWSSNLHLLRQMFSSTCLVPRVSLLIGFQFDQWILRILRKHWLIKARIVFIDALVVSHVSAPTISDFHITRNAFCFPHKILHKLLFSNSLENRWQ